MVAYHFQSAGGKGSRKVAQKRPADLGLVCFDVTKQEERRRPAILFFHSNAGDISQRLDFFKRCCRNLDVVVLAMEYRGYGRSENGGVA
ncbi:Alpha/beta hydrolase domain-containing protein 13 [Symbiodinium microadriaticum]|uniref:Alpha/beta hydrolase domain-containing protein 13 n=1 Tax=Symbiodinium microadriaticum TaxID=2951 RepID=A0A1Q9D477_SYMMI|nr:Alpha/beta hydrolase domain-containing protein 13 [Symbiodinium microadriaticum]